MYSCRCGIAIGYFDKYCSRCENNLDLREKVIEGIRKEELFGSSYLNKESQDG